MNLADIGKVIDVLRGMQGENIIEKFAIGGAFAAIDFTMNRFQQLI